PCVCVAPCARGGGDTAAAHVALGGFDAADAVHGLARLLKRGGDGFRIVFRDDDGHADAAVEGADQFLPLDGAEVAQPAEQRRQIPVGGVDHGAGALGQHAGHVLGDAAAGDVGERLDLARADGGQKLLHVDAGGGEQRLPGGDGGIERGRGGEIDVE